MRIECNDNYGKNNNLEEPPTYQPQGQELEVGLIRFLMENNEDIHNVFINRNRNAPIVV